MNCQEHNTISPRLQVTLGATNYATTSGHLLANLNVDGEVSCLSLYDVMSEVHGEVSVHRVVL